MAFVTVLFIDIIIIKYDFYNLTSKAEKNMIASVFQNYEDRRKERSLIALAFRYM